MKLDTRAPASRQLIGFCYVSLVHYPRPGYDAVPMTKAALAFLLTLAVAGAALITARLPAAAVNPQIERMSVTSAGAEGHGPSTQAAVSAGGRFVAFASDAPDLVPNNGANRDIFIHDRLTATTELISVATDGGEANGPSLFPALSADGRYVVTEMSS